jgi:hypothetical protein
MNAITVLCDEYPGDSAWGRFVDIYRPTWHLCKDKGLYISKIGDEEIAIVLSASMGEHAISWFDKACGALDKRAPSDVMSNEILGSRILRTLLMRMPN